MSEREKFSDKKDDLFSPSLQEYKAASVSPEKKPWKLESQFWIAIFGGVPAITVIAYLNSKRLDMPEKRQRRIIALGVIGMVVTIICFIIIMNVVTSPDFSTHSENIQVLIKKSGRYITNIMALLFYYLFYGIQKQADRIYHYQFHGDTPYSSLWKFGFLVIAISAIAQLIFFGLLSIPFIM